MDEGEYYKCVLQTPLCFENSCVLKTHKCYTPKCLNQFLFDKETRISMQEEMYIPIDYAIALFACHL